MQLDVHEMTTAPSTDTFLGNEQSKSQKFGILIWNFNPTTTI